MSNPSEEDPPRVAKRKFETNEELMLDLMIHSPYGGLCQAFIIEAVRYYADAVAATPAPEDDPKKVINPVAWHGIAVDIKRRLEEQNCG